MKNTPSLWLWIRYSYELQGLREKWLQARFGFANHCARITCFVSTGSGHSYLIFEVNSFHNVFTFFLSLFFFWGGSNLFCFVFCLVCFPLCVGYITINTCNHEVEVVWCDVATVNNLVSIPIHLFLQILSCFSSTKVDLHPSIIPNPLFWISVDSSKLTWCIHNFWQENVQLLTPPSKFPLQGDKSSRIHVCHACSFVWSFRQ